MVDWIWFFVGAAAGGYLGGLFHAVRMARWLALCVNHMCPKCARKFDEAFRG